MGCVTLHFAQENLQIWYITPHLASSPILHAFNPFTKILKVKNLTQLASALSEDKLQ